MSKSSPFRLDVDQQFEHLPFAPIVEAVIHWRARADRALDANQFVERLKDRLPDYPRVQSQQQVQMEMHAGPSGSAASHQAQWHGFRLESENGRQIAQFTKNGFVFSRLKPYEDWDRFEAEATRLWGLYVELAHPSEVERLGVRFINAVSPVEVGKLNRLVTMPPKPPRTMKLPVSGFMHQTTYNVPGHAYKLAVVQTIQPSSEAAAKGDTLIVDVDVFTTVPLPPDDDELSQRLQEMRYLKDTAFFALMKPGALGRFRE